jgi:cell filamentation protein
MFDKYNRKETINSKYCYSGTEVYINTFDIRDTKLLESVEAEFTFNRLAELTDQPIKGNFGIDHLKGIHKYIFQDLYSFAGKIRTEDIWKGNTLFCKCQYIESSLKRIFDELKSEQYLEDADKEYFIERSAYYMCEINVIHPFREGNGRVIREFIRTLGLKNGYQINWQFVNSEKILNAAILGVDRKYELMEECMRDSLKQ